MGYEYMDMSGNIFRLPVFKGNNKRMGTRLAMGIVNGLGMTAFLLGILANIGDWKSTVLFGLGALYGAARFVVYCIKSWQDIRWRERKLKNK